MEARLARHVAVYSWLFLSNTNTTKVGPRTWDTPQNCIECAPLCAETHDSTLVYSEIDRNTLPSIKRLQIEPTGRQILDFQTPSSAFLK